MNNYHARRWTILWILCGSLVLVVVSVSSLNVAIPEVQRALDASGSDLQWIIDSYALVFAGLLLPAGALGDRYGRREALLFGLAVFGVAAVGGTLADTPGQLIAWRGLMGAGAAFIMPSTLSIVATVFPPDERARAIAIWAGFAGAGGAIGLISSGLLLESFWWGSVFFVNVPIVVVMIVAVALVVPTSRDDDHTPLDPIGALLSIVGLVALVFAIIEGPEKGWTSIVPLTAFVVSGVALVAFIRWELRSPQPMLDPRFFRNREFSIGALTITVAFFGIFGMFFVITQYFQFVQGHSPLGAGLRILPYGLVLLFVAPRAAALAQRHGARIVMVTGTVIAAAGFGLLAMARPDTSYLVVGAALVLVATGTGLLMPPATTSLVVSLPPAKAGVASAVNDTTREVGGAVGIAVVGALVSVGYRGSLPEELPGLDPATAEHARESIGATLAAAAETSPETAARLAELAGSAFTDGVRLGMLTAAAALVVTAGSIRLIYPEPSSDGTRKAPQTP